VATAHRQHVLLPTDPWDLAPLAFEVLEITFPQAEYADRIIVCHQQLDIIVVVWAHGETCSTAAVGTLISTTGSYTSAGCVIIGVNVIVATATAAACIAHS
jgi:hypothetical protein